MNLAWKIIQVVVLYRTFIRGRRDNRMADDEVRLGRRLTDGTRRLDGRETGPKHEKRKQSCDDSKGHFFFSSHARAAGVE